jgi:uncharacterized protein YbjT (DUF2867 family)
MSQIAIVTGASGLVGVQLLHRLFRDEKYDWVVALGRRELTLKHSKLVQLKIDFEKLDRLDLVAAIRENDRGGDYQNLVQHLDKGNAIIHAYSSLGTTIKDAGSKENFYRIDHDYVVGFARWVHRLGAKRFLYVSAIDANPRAKVFYNKVKGEVERDLKSIPFEYLGLFQPSLLLGNRRESRLGEIAGGVLLKGLNLIGLFRKYKPIYGHQVARVMVERAGDADRQGVETISSTEMHKLT